MENSQIALAITPPDPGTAPEPQAGRLAAELASRHGANSAAPPAGDPAAPGRRGRKSREEELSDYLRTRGLVAVPADSTGDPGGDPDCAAGDPGPGQPPAPGYVASPAFLQECAITLLTGIRDWRKRQAYEVAKSMAGPTLAAELAAEAEPPPGTIEVMGKCVGEIASKYDLAGAWSPEVALTAAAVIWWKSDQRLMARLADLKKSAPPAASNGA